MTDKTSRRAVLGSAGLGAAMLAAFAGKAQAASGWTAQEKANVDVVNAFLKAGERKDDAGSLKYLAEDCSYRFMETAPVDKGHEAIAKRLAGFSQNADKVELKVLSTYAAGPIVINHRIDHFTSKTRPLLFEGVGVFFVKDGKIKEWTDYTIRAVQANEWPKAAKS
jgi:limonene-1,2-epoxide hydrolase